MSQLALDYARSHQSAFRDSLKSWLSIPTISTLPDYTDDLQHGAAWLAAHMEKIGLTKVTVYPTAGHPLVYGEWLSAEVNAPTVLVYGHYDVQPVDPLDQWLSPPFEPTVRGDDLYARGAVDDKGQVFIHLAAVEALLQTQRALPVNIKFLIEGEEEIGSVNLRSFIRDHQALLAADCVLISDSSMLGPDQPSLIYSLRGLSLFEITVRSARRDLHSGSYGGVIHNPHLALAKILAAMHDENGTITIPGFYDDVIPLGDDEAKLLSEQPQDFLTETGAHQLWGEAAFSPRARVGARPTFEVHGITGGFIGKGSKTIIPAQATAKVSMRLVANQDPNKIKSQFINYVKTLAPDTVEVDVSPGSLEYPSLVQRDDPAIIAASIAYEQVFGVPPIFTREGGSIPVVAMCQQILDLPVVLMGFGLPDDNLHAPNEKFHLPNFERGILTAIHFLGEYARLKTPGS